MKVCIVDKPVDVFGFKITTDNSAELTKEALIPNLWGKFHNSNLFVDEYYGVYYNYEDKHFKKYDFLVGDVFGNDDTLDKVTIQSGKYLVFEADGKFNETVPKLWFEIWKFFDKSLIKRAYKTDFEKYSKDNLIEIFVSIL